MSSSSAGAAHDTIVSCLLDEVPGLTEEEKIKLDAVIKKAKEFDAEEENKMRKPVEGQLYKYTNVVKGWQYRWFVLTPETGMLEYYMVDEIKKHRPRGGLHLAGAVISPSQEDNQSFSVNAMCGEIYKLKAVDAKERQFWVNRLRAAAEFHSEAATAVSLPVVTPSYLRSHSDQPELQVPISLTSNNQDHLKDNSVSVPTANVSPAESLTSVKQSLDEALQCQKLLIQAIESLPADGPCLRCFDSALLMLKATSQATIQCLEHCYLILHRQQTAAYFPCGLPPGAVIEWVDRFKPYNPGIPSKRNSDPLSKLS